MLRSASYDTKGNLNTGNDTDVLDYVWKLIKRNYAAKVRAVEISANNDCSSANNLEYDNPDTKKPSNLQQETNPTPPDKNNDVDLNSRNSEGREIKNFSLHKNADRFLQELSIEFCNMHYYELLKKV